jgi:serine phosphatase RsbU (regulator of sigma subunit)
VIRSGLPTFVPEIDDRVFDRLEANDQVREVVRQLGLRSAIAVPLVKKGRVLGGMQFVMSSSRRLYTQDDLRLAEAAAARIAASLDNLRLSAEQRTIASTLQASLLPADLPEMPGLELAVRYWANGDGIEVGGDFYDVFRVTEGKWAVVIGDVCGTGPTAAAVTGLARHSIASAAWHGDAHAEVLWSLNRAMRERDAGPFCTAVYGTLEPSDGGVTFTFVSGGHPLPVIARADGAVALCGTPGSLIGVFDDIDVTTTTTVLHPGDSVVLYTDGATDVPPPHDLAPEEFAGLVAAAVAVSGSAQETADQLQRGLSAILGIDERDDDIALLIFRVPVS